MEKGDIRPPLLSLIFFDTQISETLKGSPTKFFGNVRQKNFAESNDIPSLPHLSINFFATLNFLKHSTERFLYEMIQYSEAKQFRRKIVIPAPSLILNIFR